MEKFSEKRAIAPKLKDVFGVEGDQKAKWQWKGDLNATIQKVFDDKVSFVYSEDLRLDGFIIEQLWRSSDWVRQKSFGYLKILRAWGCDSLVHIIPSHLLSCFHNLEVLEVGFCKAAQVIFNISDENRVMTKPSGIFRLKIFNLYYLAKLTHIWDKDPEGIIGLQFLKEISVYNCERLKSLFPASVAKDLTRLQVLEVTECKELAEIFKDGADEEGEGTTQELVLGGLTTLRLEELPSLKYSFHCSKQQESISNLSVRDIQELCLGSRCIPNSNFGLLESLTLDDCQLLADVLLPFNLLPFLTNLKKLKVINCDSVKIIFDVKCTTQDREVAYVGPTLPFSLKKLTLINLPKLKNVWNEDPQEILSMHHLQEVCVKECEGLTSVFPPSKDKYLVKLEHLEVKDCKRLMTIFAEDNIDPRTKLELTCPFVRSLELQGLSSFKYFYYNPLYCEIFTDLESHTMNQVGTEKLFKCLSLGENGVDMILQREFKRNLLHNMKALTLCFDSDEFRYKILEQVPNIEKLVVCDGSFKKMFCRESPDNVLQQLKVLQLESLGELVSIGLENSWTDSFVRNLETFEVIRCSSLKNLVACTVSFSNLTYLKVFDCQNLSYLLRSSTAKCLGKLKRMEIKRCNSIEEIVCKEDGEESDEDEIIFPQLTCLNFMSLSKLKRFYRGSLGFPSLEELSVKYCDKMITLCVGTIIAGKLFQVKLPEVIQVEIDLNFTMRKKYMRKIASSSWEESLEFRDRTDLQEMWCLSLQIPHFCFTYLKTFIVNKCKISSYSVLPFSLLSLLPKLETLEIKNCDFVKTIFDVKCTTKDTSITPLKKLVLQKLPNLETVYSEVTEANPAHPEGTNPIITFPCVSWLTLLDLPNFKHNTIYGIHDDAPPTFELIIHNLEHLTVGKNELKMIVDGEFQRNLLDKLKVLGLCFDIECDEFPDYGFLQQLPNVKKLVVCSSSFKVIFFDQRPNNCELLSQLKELRLESLEELVSIGLENSWTEAFVRKLETFEVISCSSLENLVACTVSFSNLICLKVESCDSLSYMFTSSTAKSLGQLQRMEINNCKSIVEIVSTEREETDENEIIFSQLNCLKLNSLLNLRWFYRGSLSFPSLEELSVRYCHVMVTLCPSTLKADKLSQVTIEYDNNIPLEINLNSTTLKKFEREISELEKLELKSRPKLAEIWHEFCFSELATLIVEDCQFLSDEVLPFRLLPLLPKLKTLQVRNCDNVKVIFGVKSTQERLITFPLKKLVLSKLPNLENVWNEDTRGILSMRHLEQVFVDTCKSLKSVFPASIGKDLVNLEDLVVKDCEGLKAIVAEESDENEEIIFERLRVLDLRRLKELTCFCAGNFTLSFPSLEEVHVIECSSMKTFSAVTKIDNPTRWYYLEYARPRKETDLNSALHRNFEEALDASSAINSSDSDADGDSDHGDD